MKFEVEGRAPTNETEKKVVMAFLSTIDPGQLSSEVLDSYGWGTDGDPVATAIEILKRRVEQW